MKTTDQGQMELRARVAALLGLDVKLCPMHLSRTCCGRSLPDYPNDLNACARFETIALANGYAVQYADNLAAIITEDSFTQDLPASNFGLIHSTAEQRCRAFVKTMEGK